MGEQEWPFDDPPDVAAITLRGILEEEVPILHVTHDADDGAWQFLSAGDVGMEDARVVALARVVRADPSVVELHDLPLGWVAWRETTEDEWRRAPLPPETP